MSLEFLYIDPTAGGVGLQIVLGFLVGGFVTMKLWWASFISFFRREKKPNDDGASSVTQAPAEPRSEN